MNVATRIDGGKSTPKCASTAGVTSVIRVGSASTPIVSIGTSASPSTSDPWLPPPAWWRPPMSASSQPSVA